MSDLVTSTLDTNGVLYIVATPIGNLDDMVPRAVAVLQSVDHIAAEDTRNSARLLKYFAIDTPLIAYHDYSDERRRQQLINLLVQGSSIALIADAGTPLISDPGYQLVRCARHVGVKVIPIPGPCALITALSAAGLPSDRFIFEGFLPPKAHARQQLLEHLAFESRTLIFYESTHRLLAALEDMNKIFGDHRIIVLARELTKYFETIIEAPLKQLINRLQADNDQQKGEIVLLVKGYEQPQKIDELDRKAEQTLSILLKELPVKQAVKIAAKLTGVKKRSLYQWAVHRIDSAG